MGAYPLSFFSLIFGNMSAFIYSNIQMPMDNLISKYSNNRLKKLYFLQESVFSCKLKEKMSQNIQNISIRNYSIIYNMWILASICNA